MTDKQLMQAVAEKLVPNEDVRTQYIVTHSMADWAFAARDAVVEAGEFATWISTMSGAVLPKGYFPSTIAESHSMFRRATPRQCCEAFLAVMGSEAKGEQEQQT